jgi:hypothetical protein
MFSDWAVASSMHCLCAQDSQDDKAAGPVAAAAVMIAGGAVVLSGSRGLVRKLRGNRHAK